MLNFRLLAVGVLLSLLAVDTVNAGLFGFGRRRWERRKAQLRAELICELEHKMEQDMAREVETITAHLTATAENQVKVEAEKLQQQVQSALDQLREEASALVAAETKRLDKQITTQIGELRKQSQERVAAEAAKLKQQADAQIEAMTAKLQQETQTLKSTVEQEIAKIPAQIVREIDKAFAQRAAPGKVEASEGPKENDEPIEKQQNGVSAGEPSALPGKEVELVEAASDAPAE
jgi:hypothetical protein